MESTIQNYTYADYQKLPEGAPYQLIGGELVMSPAPTLYHQRIIRKLVNLLSNFVESHHLGEVFFAPVDVFLDHENTFQPDIVFVSKERAAIMDEQKINGAPDLVVEILSPSTAYYDLKKKKEMYEKYGVKEYWIVDPMEKTIDVLVHRNGSFTLNAQAKMNQPIASVIIAGFEVNTKNIF